MLLLKWSIYVIVVKLVVVGYQKSTMEKCFLDKKHYLSRVSVFTDTIEVWLWASRSYSGEGSASPSVFLY
jgi:hypothetical protein